MSHSATKRFRPSTRSTSIVNCLVCKEPQINTIALDHHCQVKHTKRQMIETVIKFADKSEEEIIENQNIEDESSNSTKESSPSPVRATSCKSIETGTTRSYNFRTPSAASILKQRNSITLTSSSSSSPCNSTTSNSNSPSPYFTPEQTIKRTRRRKQRLDSLMLDFEDDTSKCSPLNLIKLPPCSDIKEGIKKLKEQAKEDENNFKLDSDTDSCSDMAMPSVYCSFCSNGYKSIEELEQHVLECPKKDTAVEKSCELTELAQKIYVCYFCGQEFTLKYILKDHLKEHVRENILSDITQMENDFDLRPESNFIYHYFNYFSAGYNFGVNDKGACSKSDLHYKFYEHLFQGINSTALNPEVKD